MKDYPRDYIELSEQGNKNKTITNSESQENLYPSSIQGLFERLGLE